jgi:hypothetical protein
MKGKHFIQLMPLVEVDERLRHHAPIPMPCKCYANANDGQGMNQ